jgi:hypothetical protein
VLEWGKRQDLVPAGTVTGGIVITGVPDRVQHVLAPDATLPDHGKSTNKELAGIS